MRDMEKHYTPSDVENRIYDNWMKSDCFKADPNSDAKPYTIVIPPPNVTGALHMGHALNNTLQDILIRRKRMQGFDTLWQPGTDHAGIATQSVVERLLLAEGTDKHKLGREKFIERVWEWKKEYGNRIIDQLKRLGCSCDWSRTRFTMDEGLSKAVGEVFVRLYEEGLIYRGTRLINWCPKLQTALSDEEVENKEIDGHFWSIRYHLADDNDRFIVVSTTRPETMFGDSAIAVHPDDKRYKDFVGKYVYIPLTDKRIPIITDEHADPEKGTGAVKITPAHDFNDYEVGLRHDLPMVICINPDATMNENAGKYKGQNRFECRKNLIKDLKDGNFIENIEDRVVPVPLCYRTGDVIEPYLMNQWFVKMKPLAEPALESVANGNTKIVPSRYTKTYNAWLDQFRDWCISRQLWWGHRIPAWYAVSETEGIVKSETPVYVARSEEEAFEKASAIHGKDVVLKQEEDVLDTWFSSALWPFSTLGWPDKTSELEKYYPTDVLVTARDIIYFWVARMMISGLKFMGKEPFHTVFINGTILDEKGQRMSKSKGNGIDPIDLIEKYGADATRFSLMTLTSEGQDIKLSMSKFDSGRNFANKLWNASRFLIGTIKEKLDFEELPPTERLFEVDKWILSKLGKTIKSVNKSLDEYKFNDATSALYDFTWHDFCDWYIEAKKNDLYQESDLQRRDDALNLCSYVLGNVLKLLHPFMPYVTEEIWSYLKDVVNYPSLIDNDLLIKASFPTAEDLVIDDNVENNFNLLQEIIVSLRTIRAENNIPPNKKGSAVIIPKDKSIEKWISGQVELINSFAKLTETIVNCDVEKPKLAGQAVVFGNRVYLELGNLIDKDIEIERLTKEIEKATKLKIATEKKLSNEKFVNKAPAKVVDNERNKLAGIILNLEKLEKSIEALKG